MEEITKTQYDELTKNWTDRVEKEIKNGFIGNDGEHHEYEYDEENYRWRTYMTNEEFCLMNDSKKLEGCKKCSMWENCRSKEYTVTTMSCIIRKGTDDITKEINRRILEDMELLTE